MDGIYTMDSVQVPAGAKIRASDGARPIIVHSSGRPPAVEMGAGSELHGVWFGGARDEKNATELHPGVNSIIQDCVFFNYVEAIGEGAASGVQYLNNRFVNCGQGTLKHTIYINNSDTGHTSLVQENIFVGGQAYHIQCWHDPAAAIVQSNFSADADWCIVPQGIGHVVDRNIFWKPSSPGYPINRATGKSRTYTRNYHGPIASGSERGGHPDWFGGNLPEDIKSENNYYCAKTLEAYEDNAPTFTEDGGEVKYLGKSAVEIDAAIAALEASFAESVATIHDDATIAGNFAVLQTCIDTWEAYTA